MSLSIAESVLRLHVENAHPRDERIQFDEPTHTYTIDGVVDHTSVTTFMHQFFPKFEPDNAIVGIHRSPKWKNDPSYRYYQKTGDEIKEMWKNATEAGTRLHETIEQHCNRNDVAWTGPEWEQYLQFRQDYPHLEPYRTEWFVFDKELKLAGSIDAVFRDTRDDTLVIIDWKRNIGLEPDILVKDDRFRWCETTLPPQRAKPWDKPAFTPISSINASRFWQHSCQVNMYWYMLEENYNLTIKEAWLVALHPDYDRQHFINVPQLRPEILRLTGWRAHELAISPAVPEKGGGSGEEEHSRNIPVNTPISNTRNDIRRVKSGKPKKGQFAFRAWN